MQHAFIITGIDSFTSEQSGQVFRLSLAEHKGRELSVIGSAEQQVNILTIKEQVLPVVMLSDKLEEGADSCLLIPDSALVSIVPIKAAAVQLMLDTDNADQVLHSLSPNS